MGRMCRLYEWWKTYKATVRATTWLVAFFVGFLCFIPVYESAYAEALRAAYREYPVLKEVFSVEELVLSTIVLSGVVAAFGFSVLFTAYYVAPDRTATINQVAEKVSFVFEGPSKLLFLAGFLLLGVAGSGLVHDQGLAGARIGLISLLACFLPAAYFRWQSKAQINDRPWLRGNAIWLAGICGLLGVTGLVYTFAEKWLSLAKIVGALVR